MRSRLSIGFSPISRTFMSSIFCFYDQIPLGSPEKKGFYPTQAPSLSPLSILNQNAEIIRSCVKKRKIFRAACCETEIQKIPLLLKVRKSGRNRKTIVISTAELLKQFPEKSILQQVLFSCLFAA